MHASCRILGDEKSRMKRNNVRRRGIKKDTIEMDLKLTGLYSVDWIHLLEDKLKWHLLSTWK